MELIEARPDWGVLGSGITLQGNALRVLRELGVWDEVQKTGFAFDSVGLAAPDGTVFHVQQNIRPIPRMRYALATWCAPPAFLARAATRRCGPAMCGC